ncbi:T9SS type A sorting domain-containing protein [Gracilimonas mengyeensis]|uniref:Por secretion system C-terminal sorting domain-containing protein n=1 Tax=Gracilimonas mengyeensis TaxID=1302730 RepID=A0A521EPF2_9BACT|nr:T9SS type A sorting domain-containing protein [Gracilimonas mengyeensis]SMO85809.1 Por secretion system C-terminal sorting domain-containing protein [Gracilimonas mengyeensis]
MVSANRILVISFLAAVILSIGSGIAFSQTHTWTGTVSTDWNDAANWDAGTIPGSSSSVKITNMTNKPVLSNTTTVASVQVGSNWPGSGVTTLTIANGSNLTITNSLSFISGGSLHIDGGAVNHTGTSYSMGYNASQYIEMTSGSFTTNANVSTTGGDGTQPAFSAGNGSATFNGDLTVNSNKRFDVQNGTVEINGETNINGIYNGDDGITTFNDEVQVGSGGVLDLDSGTLNFNAFSSISNNGTAYLGTGTANFADDVNVQSGGYLYVESGEMNVSGDANFSNNGNLYVDDGSVNVTGNASLSSGGEMSFTSGSFSVGGDASFTGGGDVNLGDSDVDLQGNLTVQSGANFDAGTSNVTFSGNGTQTINTNGNDIEFYDVTVGSNTTLETDGSSENTIIIENSLTVENGGNVVVQDNDTIDIQGELDDDGGGVVSSRPFVYSISTPSLTEVVVTYNKAMDETTSETVSNYSINNGISVSSATLNPSNNKQVTLVVSTLTEGVEYELTINNVESTDGGVISTNHLKRFTVVTQTVFYSRQNGNWNSNSTWSTVSHTGAAASSNPSTENDAEIIIGNSHTVTVNSSATITDQQSVTVNSGTLLVGSGGTLTLGTDVITGGGTFQVGSGTIEIGSTAGITSSGSSGNIQTSTRIFSSSGSYTYNGSSSQSTGSGLPGQANNLRIDNASGVSHNSNLEVTGTLYLTDGTLTMGTGDELIANTKSISGGNLTMQHRITGSTGWRLLSSPISSSYGDLLDNTITQGFSGAYYSTGSNPGDTLQPNVMYYDESYATNSNGGPATDNQRWRAPSSASSNVPDGRGHYVFFFGDIDGDPLYDNLFDFPITLGVTGQENSGSTNFGITYTTAADSGWNLVGNPYAASIDWDDSGSWTKTNVDNTIYIWDPGSSSFKTWNGTTGNLPSQGLISPFQGFWVKANGASPTLEVDESAKTFGGDFVGKTQSKTHTEPIISLRISDGDKEASTHFMFSDEASINKDVMDAYRLLPPPDIGTYLAISSVSEEGEHFTINNLPRKFGRPIEIPIYAEAFEAGYSSSSQVELSIDELKNIPSGWKVSLVDRETNSEINVGSAFSYSFNLDGIAQKKAPNADGDGKPKVAAKRNNNARFMLVIDPGSDANNLPQNFDLSQNYPNPFNPTTNIAFELPVQSYAELSIYDMLGRRVATLVQDEIPAGQHTFQWDASQVSSGIYIYRFMTNQTVITKKMTLIK